jgi:hypothetical protein
MATLSSPTTSHIAAPASSQTQQSTPAAAVETPNVAPVAVDASALVLAAASIPPSVSDAAARHEGASSSEAPVLGPSPDAATASRDVVRDGYPGLFGVHVGNVAPLSPIMFVQKPN